MRFLTLPPLVVILLLVFLWFILLVLLLWTALRARRTPPDPQGETQLEASKRGDTPPRPVRVARPQVVREARSGNTGKEASDDAFDDFMKPGNRRDDFDF